MTRSPPQRPLRVAHLMQYFQLGGLENMVCGLVREARERGVRSEVVAYVGDGPIRQRLEQDGASTSFLPTEYGKQYALPLRLAALLARRGVEVLHTHHLGPFIYGAMAARLLRIPHVHTEHSLEFYDTTRRRLVGRAMRFAAEVTCVAPSIAEWRHEAFGDSATVIRNGIPIPGPPDEAAVRAARALIGLDDRLTVGCVARLSAEKDHATLLRAFGHLRDRGVDARLVLVGGGAERPRLEALAAQLALDDRVTFLGERHDVGALYPAFDLGALSSVREGLPLALLEGMAHGRPFVATAVGEIPALAAAGAGVVVPPQQPAALADALAAYLADAPRRRADGDRARALAAAEYSLDSMVDRYVAIYRRLAGR